MASMKKRLSKVFRNLKSRNSQAKSSASTLHDGDSYGKALGLLAPIKDLNDDDFSDQKIQEIVATMTSLCYVEVNSADIAKEIIVSVRNQSGIGANYVCARYTEEEEYKSAAKTTVL